MMLLLKVKEKNYSSTVYEDEPDPLTDGRGVGLIVSRRIMCCFGIPVSGEPAKVRAYSLSGKDFDPALPDVWGGVTVKPENSPPIPVLLWTESMKARADELLPKAGSRWKYNWLLPAMGLALLLLAAWGLASGLTLSSLKEEQAACLAEVRPGDILVTQVCRQRDSLDKDYLVAFEVAEVKGDTLFLRQGDKRGARLRVYELSEIRAAALEFVASGNSFASEARPFTRPFKEEPERLKDPDLPGVNMDVEYVIRPKS